MTYNEFLIETDFYNKINSFFDYSNSNPLKNRKFEEIYPEIKSLFEQNENEVISSFFENIYLDIKLNDNKKLNKYLSFIILEFTTDKHYKYFQILLEKVHQKISNNKDIDKYLTFIWVILDCILHFGINLKDPENFNNLFKNIYNLSFQIDPEDNYLLQQKIEQLI